MSHELSMNNGKAEMFYYGEKPWHGLGTEVQGALTSAEAITAAGLNWKVQKTPVKYLTPAGQLLEVPGKFVNYRDDLQTPLGVVGKDYTIVQNKDCFSFFDAVVGEKAAMYHTAGALFGGRKVWLLAKLPQDTIVKGVDISKNYLLLSNSHDGTSNLKIMFSSVRVVCSNTLSMAINGAGNISMLRHTANIGLRVRQVREFLGITTAVAAKYGAYANALAEKGISNAIIEDFFQRMGLSVLDTEPETVRTRRENQQEEILSKLEVTNRATPEIKDTRWALLNAYTDYVDHVKAVKPSNDQDKWVDSILFGNAAESKQKALKELLAI